jgi:hypothetical protein
MDDREILDLINTGKVEMFDYSGFFKRGKHLRCFETKSISSNFPIYLPSCDVDIWTEWMGRIKDDFRVSVHSMSMKKIFGSDMFSSIDYRGISDRDYSIDLVHEITKRQYKNVLVSPKIAALIQDTAFFIPDANIGRGSLSSCYRIGSIFSNKDIYVNPYLKWDDMRVCLFNDVFANIEEVRADVQNEATFRPRIMIEFEFDFNCGPSEVLYLRDDEYPNIDPFIVPLLRDIKINEILDEDRRF